MPVVISVRGVGKKYRLGATLGNDTLRDHLAQAVGALFGKKNQTEKADESFWALKDVSFDVKQGEIVGVIGRNGAGKSTLLKILSQITEPTEGEIHIKGRMASLLEVGTGFHPELSGRENIFLNGAILGMSQTEIKKKFDEIVAFAEVEKFLDTPVKRYSSGMYVRLAFAVAAHLEPEILVVDEVLAVGDASFQKKCLGKMQDVAQRQGRTVLFVSHNMVAMKSLCTHAILLEKGRMIENGEVEPIINSYLQKASENVWQRNFTNQAEAPGNEKVRFKSICLVPDLKAGETQPTPETPLRVECEFWNSLPDASINLSMSVETRGECVFVSASTPALLNPGQYAGVCQIPGNLLNDGVYTISMQLTKDRSVPLFKFADALTFEVVESRRDFHWHGKWRGVVRPNLEWQYPK